MNAATIFDFDDYRKFLKNRIAELRASDPKFRKGYFAEVCGFTGAYLSMVLNGKRNLTDNMISKICDFLDLKTAERNYFRLLVKLNQAINPEEKLAWARQIMASKGFLKHHPLASAQYRYFSKWYYPALLEYLSGNPSSQSKAVISKAFIEKIPEKEISRALQDLQDLGLLAQKADGRLYPVQNTVVTTETVHSHFLTDFYRQILGLAGESLLTTHEDFREIAGLTFAIDLHKIPKLKQVVRNFHQELFSILSAESQGQVVFNMTFALFPLSKIEDPE